MSLGVTPLKDYNKPEYITRGVWFSLHTLAEMANTAELKRAYAAFFRKICSSMTCDCEGHCKEMLLQNPPEAYFDKVDEFGKPNGCLIHSILCHNLVNKRLGKRVYEYAEIAPLYQKKAQAFSCKRDTEDVKVYPASLADIAKLHPNIVEPITDPDLFRW